MREKTLKIIGTGLILINSLVGCKDDRYFTAKDVVCKIDIYGLYKFECIKDCNKMAYRDYRKGDRHLNNSNRVYNEYTKNWNYKEAMEALDACEIEFERHKIKLDRD